MLEVEASVLIGDELVPVHHIEGLPVVVVELIAGVYLQQRIGKRAKYFAPKDIVVYRTEGCNLKMVRDTERHFLVIISAVPYIAQAEGGSKLYNRIYGAEATAEVMTLYECLLVGVA